MLGLSDIILFKSLLHVFCSLVFSAHNSSEHFTVELNFKIKDGSDVYFDSNYFYLVMDDRGGIIYLDFLLGSIDTLP